MGDSLKFHDLAPDISQIIIGNGQFYQPGTRRCPTAVLERGGPAIIPILKNGRRWKEHCPAAQARIDILLRAQRLERAEIHIRIFTGSLEPIVFTCSIMNRFNILRSAEIQRVPDLKGKKGLLRPRQETRDRAMRKHSHLLRLESARASGRFCLRRVEHSRSMWVSSFSKALG